MTRFVALLRGINVGGNNLIRMADLKGAFEGAGFEDVSTYIASGNVIFTSQGKSAALESRIERVLSKAFGYEARVLVRSRSELASTLKAAPKGWPDKRRRCNVVFLKAPLTPKAALAAIPPLHKEVDSLAAGPRALYLGQLLAKMPKSRVSKIASIPEYKSMTIRTYATCERILALMDA